MYHSQRLTELRQSSAQLGLITAYFLPINIFCKEGEIVDSCRLLHPHPLLPLSSHLLQFLVLHLGWQEGVLEQLCGRRPQVRVVVQQQPDHLTLGLAGVKGRRKADLWLPQLHQDLVSLHGCREGGMAHLEEDDAETVGVDFLQNRKTNKKTKKKQRSVKR